MWRVIYFLVFFFLLHRNESRLPTPRSSRQAESAHVASQRSLQLTKPPIAPTSAGHHPTGVPLHGQSTASVVMTSNGTGRAVKSGRTPMAYGGQRSATTSIMQNVSSLCVILNVLDKFLRKRTNPNAFVRLCSTSI